MNIRKPLAAAPVVAIAITFLACSSQPKGNNSGADSPPPSVPGGTAPWAAPAPAAAAPEITLTEFDKIQNGQTYEQVKEIVGVAGEVQSEYAAPDPQYSSKTYTFKGDSFAEATVTFTAGVVSMKMQFGLKP